MSVPMAGTAIRHLLCRKGASAAAPELGLHSTAHTCTSCRISPIRVPGKLRTFHASGTKLLEYSNDYIYAPTMYDIAKIKRRKLKFGIGVFGGVAVGTLVPVFAVCFQQGKANSGKTVKKH